MTALDLSPFVASSEDSDELRAYKTQVKEVAEAYTRRHGWCGEVRRALKEIGIEEERPVEVVANTALGLQMNVSILPSLLFNKSEEQQKDIIAEKVGPLSLVGSGASAMLRLTGESITELALKTQPGQTNPGRTLLQNQQGTVRYIWRRIGDGRVLHLFRLRRNVESQSDYVSSDHLNNDSMCSQVNPHWSTIRAWNDDEAERAECTTCARRVTTNNLIPYIPPPVVQGGEETIDMG